MIGGVYIEEHALLTVEAVKNSTAVFILYSIEETLEMIGVAYFIYTLFVCMETNKTPSVVKRDVSFFSTFKASVDKIPTLVRKFCSCEK